MFDTVLIPTDGSDSAQRAARLGVALAEAYGATVHALAVVDERQFAQLEGDSKFETERTLEENCERAVGAVVERARDEGIQAETAIQRGVPSQRIVEYAAENGIDVIAMGTHGRSDHERIATVGSVTQRVVENADVPVFVVHIGRSTGWG
jgi:nucleotide-binding universal stress UspA family protein